MPRQDLIQLRSGTAAEWTSANPVLAAGELGFEIDTKKLKGGDGVTSWSALPYLTGGGGGGSTWGTITGTLSAQTDLQNALNEKVSTSSLNENIDDRVAALLQAGSNITLTYNDTLGTLTIAASGGSGNSYFPSGW